jgi:hypothetical protein
MKPSRDHWLKEKMITELVLEVLLTAKKVGLKEFSKLFKKMLIYFIIEFDYQMSETKKYMYCKKGLD